MKHILKYAEHNVFETDLENEVVTEPYVAYCTDEDHVEVPAPLLFRSGYLYYNLANDNYYDNYGFSNVYYYKDSCLHIILANIKWHNKGDIFETFELVSDDEELKSRIVYDDNKKAYCLKLTIEESNVVKGKEESDEALAIYRQYGTLQIQASIKENIYNLPFGTFRYTPLYDYSDDVFRGLTSFGRNTGEYNWYGQCFERTPLRRIFIPNTVEIIDNGCFIHCQHTTEVIFEKNSSLKRIGYEAFDECLSLMEIEIPESVEKIEGEFISGCQLIKKLNIPKNVKELDDYEGLVFWGMASLEEITVDKDNPYFNDGNGSNCLIDTETNTCYGMVYNSVIPKEVKRIEYYCFGNEAYTEGAIDGNDCSINGYLRQQETNITFEEGSQLEEISSNAFVSGLPKQRELILPDSLKVCDSYNFYDNVKDISHFVVSRNLETVGTRTFDGIYVTQDNFENRSSLSIEDIHVNIIDEETEDGLCIIGDTIVNCRTWATNVTIPSYVTTIKNESFDDCYEIEELRIPEGVTSIIQNKSTYEYIFGDLIKLKKLYLPSTLTTIPAGSSYSNLYAYNLLSLTDIYYNGTIAQYKSIFKKTFKSNCVETLTIHCTDGDITE